jgi:uncharacterized phiE125 gp8 family phage protein
MPIRVITPPVLEPITLAEAKAQCRVDIDDDDALIVGLIRAAREYCEAVDWRAYLTQTIELWLEAWPDGDELELPRPPLQSVTSVVYYDTSDVPATLAATDYYVDTISTPGSIQLRYLKTWPATTLRDYNAICVTYKAGWSTVTDMPQSLRQAMLLLIGHWYENREAVLVGAISKSIEFAVQSLLGLHAVKRF